ncbi:unnamed protein product [Moneuplotes crassus]|uniref:Enoyl-CoA hydratase n=1 Tax=Euplotes crassus TaxID=5936 RepID=A0AAD1XWQ9_EUPCR|nr:unnamed protein product [Moneuplotes crassus]
MSRLKQAIDKTVSLKTPVGYFRNGNLDIIVMNQNDNRLNLKFCEELHQALDQLEVQKESRGQTLVTLSTHPKIYSNGVDFENLRNDKEIEQVLEGLHQYILRILQSKIPTVGCIDGHAFAGGWFMAIAHHFRIMNTDRGWICLNGISLDIPIPKAFNVLGTQKIGEQQYWETCCLGTRFNAYEALERGIVHKIYNSENILKKTEDFADHLAKKNLDPIAFRLMNADIYNSSIHSLSNDKNWDLTIQKVSNCL